MFYKQMGSWVFCLTKQGGRYQNYRHIYIIKLCIYYLKLPDNLSVYALNLSHFIAGLISWNATLKFKEIEVLIYTLFNSSP
jgi:hypothetical protein